MDIIKPAIKTAKHVHIPARRVRRKAYQLVAVLLDEVLNMMYQTATLGSVNGASQAVKGSTSNIYSDVDISDGGLGNFSSVAGLKVSKVAPNDDSVNMMLVNRLVCFTSTEKCRDSTLVEFAADVRTPQNTYKMLDLEIKNQLSKYLKQLVIVN